MESVGSFLATSRLMRIRRLLFLWGILGRSICKWRRASWLVRAGWVGRSMRSWRISWPSWAMSALTWRTDWVFFFQNWDFHVRKKRSNKNQKITEGCVFSFLDHSVSTTLLSLSRCVYIGGDAFQHSNGFVFDDVLGSDHQQGEAWRPSGGFKKGLQLYVQKTWRFSWRPSRCHQSEARPAHDGHVCDSSLLNGVPCKLFVLSWISQKYHFWSGLENLSMIRYGRIWLYGERQFSGCRT